MAKAPSPERVRLRAKEFEPAKCGRCRYYNPLTKWCRVLAQTVLPEQTCDAFQGWRPTILRYKVAREDFGAFARGLKLAQPLQNVVRGGLHTPAGFLLLLQDTMQPRPHFFSVDMGFSALTNSREHGWTQEEVDRLIRVGQRGSALNFTGIAGR